jgi:histidinol-phosphate/aromatic aminotransferase/cobyric acid decarboxylase-like protein
MRFTYAEPLVAAPQLLDAFRKGREEFGIAAMSYCATRRLLTKDAGLEECLEMLDHLVDRLGDSSNSQGLEDACLFLLEHLTARFNEQVATGTGVLIQ